VRHVNSMSTLLLLWRRIKLLCGEEVEEWGGMPTACQLSCCYGVELNCYVERKWKRVRHANSSMSTFVGHILSICRMSMNGGTQAIEIIESRDSTVQLATRYLHFKSFLTSFADPDPVLSLPRGSGMKFVRIPYPVPFFGQIF
jgi:hypothetical protein